MKMVPVHKNRVIFISKILFIFCLIIVSAAYTSCETRVNPTDENKSPKSCVVPNHKGTSYFLATGCTDQQRCDSVVREGENECCDSVLEAGQSIAGNGTVLGLKCADSFILRRPHSDIVVCYDGKWYPGRHACQRTCKGIDLNTLEKNCTYQGEPVSCDRDIRVGTKATIACKPGFITDREYGEENHCLKSGKWKYIMHNCAPICGVIEDHRFERAFRSSDETIDASHAPWNAAIYMAHNGTFKLICGGALISEEFILTAAKCVKDESGTLRNASLLRVALGKTFKDWNNPLDSETAQKFHVKSITSNAVFEAFFSGGSEMLNFVRHLAVLNLKGMVNFDTIVTPICIDLARLNERVPDLIGTVVGWNLNENASASLQLQSFLRPIENNAVCIKRAKPHEKIDNPTKFCTQRIKPLSKYYGNGITFRDNITDKHYVIGILTDHFEDITVFLGYRDDASAAIVNMMRFYFDKAKVVKSVQ